MYAIAANNGVQIIVETHSDHFLNDTYTNLQKKGPGSTVCGQKYCHM
jgi:predicted ATPase